MRDREAAAWTASYLASLLERLPYADPQEVDVAASDAQAAANALGEEGTTLRGILQRLRRDLGVAQYAGMGQPEAFSRMKVAESLNDWARRLRE